MLAWLGMYTLDVTILKLLHSTSTPWLDHLAVAITQLGGAVFITVVVALLAIGLLTRRQTGAALTLILTVGGAGILTIGLKLLFQRGRPSLWDVLTVETTYSFPSGHAVASSALGFALIILLWRTRWRTLSLAIGTGYIIAVGLTRMYLGVHFPSDVFAGWLISLGWALLVYWGVRKLSRGLAAPANTKKL